MAIKKSQDEFGHAPILIRLDITLKKGTINQSRKLYSNTSVRHSIPKKI